MPSLFYGVVVLDREKPLAEVLVEGELSPFEHEALYRILRRSFQVEQPSYVELLDEGLATRINVTFHYPYARTFFTEILRENWRDLKELFRQVRYRRGRVGAAFTLTFVGKENQLVFKSGAVEEREMGSAMDQIGHLTGIIGQMVRPENMEKPIVMIESFYDKASDRWHEFRGYGSVSDETYRFDESAFRWVAIRNDPSTRAS